MDNSGNSAGPKKATAKQIKNQLKANLAQNQVKKNQELIRQGLPRKNQVQNKPSPQPPTASEPITGQIKNIKIKPLETIESKPELSKNKNFEINPPKIFHSDVKEILEQQKLGQEKYILDLNLYINRSKKSIKNSQSYIQTLEKSLSTAKDTGSSTQVVDISKAIDEYKQIIKEQDKHRKYYEHLLFDAKKTLEELHQRINFAENTNKNNISAKAQIKAAKGGIKAANFLTQAIKNRFSKKSAAEESSTNAQVSSNSESINSIQTSTSGNLSSVSYNQAPLSNSGQFQNPAASALGTVKSLKNIARTIKNLKTIIKTVKLLATSATGVGAVANLALLLKDKIAKIRKYIAIALAGIGTMLVLLWLWLLAKIAGIISGAIFGLVTGAPLLLVPGVGPFLYAGWVGYWTWKGWTDPIATMHLATHPWELITRPLSWVGDKLSGLGGGVKGGTEVVAGGIGNAAGGLLSTAGSFITGTASALWGGVAGSVVGVVSTSASIAGSIWSGLTGAGSAIAGNVVQVAVGGSIASVAGVAVVGTIMTNSAFYTQDLDSPEQFFPPGENELFTISKSANQAQIPNPEVLTTIPVTFTVRVTATQNLVSPQISDQTTAANNTSLSISANTCQQANLPASIATGSTFECTLTIQVNVEQSDSTITNTATFTGTGESGVSATETASATVRVGNAPQTCDNFNFVTGDPGFGTPAAWTQPEIDTINSICETLLARSPTLMGFINTASTITLERYSGGCSGMVNGATVARFFGCNLSSYDSAKYVFIHELGHVIGNVNGPLYQSFLNSGAFSNEGMIKTYPICPGNINESFAEMIADYVVAHTYNFPARCTGYPGGPYTTFQNDYPMHYNFARNSIFGGVTY